MTEMRETRGKTRKKEQRGGVRAPVLVSSWYVGLLLSRDHSPARGVVP